MRCKFSCQIKVTTYIVFGLAVKWGREKDREKDIVNGPYEITTRDLGKGYRAYGVGINGLRALHNL